MQQDNFIKNKLQQLENQQLPDLSQMDEHWEKMQAALVPAKPAPVKRFPKSGLWMIAVAVLIASVILVSKYTHKRDDLIASQNKSNIENPIMVKDSATVTAIVLDSPDVKTEPATPVKKFVLNLNSGKKIVQNVVPVPDSNDQAVVDTSSTPVMTDVSRQQLLKNLFNGIAKSPQEFEIDNSKDTLLFGSEGGAIFIPAKTLNNGKVIISVQEFYSKSDMVLNRLATMSSGAQLVSGGMINVIASSEGKEIKLSAQNPVKWFLPDTSDEMKKMQLFAGEKENLSFSQHPQNQDTVASVVQRRGINWLPQPQYFQNFETKTEVRVLDLRNEPYKIIDNRIAVFNLATNPALPKKELKKLLKEKYGYEKVRFGFRANRFFKRSKYSSGDIDLSDAAVGDSVWMPKELAGKYNLKPSATRILPNNNRMARLSGNAGIYKVLRNGANEQINGKYGVDITSLGWINCDRFYYDSRKKTDFYADLGDTASNYYTVLVFDRLKSILAGNINGNKVAFFNLPEGEPVTIISIGIGKDGQSVMAMKSTTVGNKEQNDLHFETIAKTDLKASLSKIDN